MGEDFGSVDIVDQIVSPSLVTMALRSSKLTFTAQTLFPTSEFCELLVAFSWRLRNPGGVGSPITMDLFCPTACGTIAYQGELLRVTEEGCSEDW